MDLAGAQEALDAMLSAGNGPGLFASVWQDGVCVFTGTAGVADLTTQRPIVAEDRFRVASLTKMYVAVVVLQLVAEGRLRVEDPVGDHLDGYELPAGLTIADLLRLRSGLPDYVEALLGSPPDPAVLARYHAPRELIRLALSLDGRGEPGQSWRYSNTDYLLLGLVVEAVTGQRLDAQLWQRICVPLGLVDTDLPTVDPRLRGSHASGYLRMMPDRPYQEFTAVTPSESWASGALVSTPAEVARFLDALIGGELLPPEQLAAMRTTMPVDDTRAYGYGIFRITLPGDVVAYGHRGNTIGYTSIALRNDLGRTVVLYQNSLDFAAQLQYDSPFLRVAFSDAARAPSEATPIAP